MKKLLIAIVIAATLWSGYWFVGAFGVKTGLTTWLDAQRNSGWVAETKDIAVKGFPNRFDTTFTDISLADPRSGWAWEAAFFQMFTLSYRPNHVIASWPNHQVLATPLATYDIHSEKMQGSAVMDELTTLAIGRANLVADQLSIVTRDGDRTDMNALRFAMRRADDSNLYQLALQADDFAPSERFRKLIGKTDLPRRFSSLQADMTLGFDAPWDRLALEQRRPQPTSVKLSLAEAKWGELELAAAGELALDDTGRAEGRITVKARNWRDILQMAVQAELVPESVSKQVEGGLSALAGMSGNQDTLDLPIDFRSGLMFVGIIPIGQAPVFQIR